MYRPISVVNSVFLGGGQFRGFVLCWCWVLGLLPVAGMHIKLHGLFSSWRHGDGC
jgi:hypothetical protein